MKKLGAVCTVVAIVAFALACVLCLVHGGCGGTLETTAGSSVPMKCHWAYLSSAVLAALGAIAALLALVGKQAESKRLCGALCVLLGLAVFAVLFALIGVCSGQDMACVVHRLPVAACMVLGIIAALIAMANPGGNSSSLFGDDL